MGVFRTSLSKTLRDGLAPVVALKDEQGAEVYYTLALGPRMRLTASAEALDPAFRDRDDVVFLGLRLRVQP